LLLKSCEANHLLPQLFFLCRQPGAKNGRNAVRRGFTGETVAFLKTYCLPAVGYAINEQMKAMKTDAAFPGQLSRIHTGRPGNGTAFIISTNQ
jgi:hypothetical protein